MWAAYKGNLPMVKALVENGASLLKSKDDGLTLLHISASLNDVHVLDYAIKNRNTESIDIKNEDVTHITTLFKSQMFISYLFWFRA
jgi:ankyrin repeat protein